MARRASIELSREEAWALKQLVHEANRQGRNVHTGVDQATLYGRLNLLWAALQEEERDRTPPHYPYSSHYPRFQTKEGTQSRRQERDPVGQIGHSENVRVVRSKEGQVLHEIPAEPEGESTPPTGVWL